MSAPRISGGAVRVGTALGIPLRIHFTFLLLLLWFGLGSAGTGEGFFSGVVFILLLFGCVALHELGHAAMARRFGVETREIVLYPIGGVARLDRIPSGKAELFIALAGPAVNLILAGMLVVFLLFRPAQQTFSPQALVDGQAPVVWQLLTANLSLFFFNLIPAFPMDGGRILRSILSLVWGQERATRIASRIGQGFAVLFAIWAVVPPFKPVFLMIAFFVFIGAGQEAAYERHRSAVAGLTARSAMITRYETIAPQESLGRAAELLLSTHQQDFPVIDAWGRVAGLLHRVTLIQALALPGGNDRAVLEVMDREPPMVPADLPLEAVLRYLQSRPLQALLVTGESGLLGMITLDNLGQLIQITESQKKG
ncbi:MAG: site-2 protease family protein [Thermoanaerobaculia bacterium]